MAVTLAPERASISRGMHMGAIALFVLATLISVVPFVMWLSRRRRGTLPAEAAEALKAFLNGGGHASAWDDFLGEPIDDPALEAIRIRCARLPVEFPPSEQGQYCSAAGVEVVRGYLRELSRQAPQQGST
jgi:hypothetical protein